MNFLAHLLLSKDNEKEMVGNFIGDFVKGSQLESYDQEIQLGIKLHRSIDEYTDNHPIVLKSKIRLREKFRHYAPVIVDIFYDHFLAKKWSSFSNEPLMDFTLRFYELMKGYYPIIPKGVVNMLRYMKEGNWLFNYQFIEGIDKALTGMSRRTKFESKMEHASVALEENYNEFENEFLLFFPHLQKHVANFEG
ncbi:acyl carrier protein phosphodiesterase [Ekhidna sp.]